MSIALNCRLPVTWSGKAGFLGLPGGLISEDSSARANSQFFDAAFSRWLPVAREAVSPNGAKYAYSDGSTYQGIEGHIHVVDVFTNDDRVIYSGSVYRVVDFASEGIYVTADMGEGPYAGLWLMNPTNGSLRLINAHVRSPAVGVGAAWGEDFNPADPSPAPAGIAGSTNRVVRVNLASGATTPWFYTPGAQPTILGIDHAGVPFVRIDTQPPNDPDVNHDTNELWRVTSQTGAVRLLSSTGWYDGPSRLGAIDSHGIWFDGGDGIWLYAQGAMNLVGRPVGAQLSVAGGCLNVS